VATTDKSKLLLVDFENVQKVALTELDSNYRVVIFVGASQKNLPFDLVTVAQQLGNRVEWQKVAGEGRNALDFFIACELGRVMDRSPQPECTVLSNDKGFDPLLKHLTATGMKCRRISSLHELRRATAAPLPETAHARHAPAATPSETPHVRRVTELLGKLEKKARPRRLRTLAQSIAAMYQNRLTKQQVDGVISAMLANRLITESEGKITYEF
jgi:hypothetical protein